MQAISLGICLEEPRVVVKYLGGLISNILRDLQIISMKSIHESNKKALNFEMNGNKGQPHKVQEETNKIKYKNSWEKEGS